MKLGRLTNEQMLEMINKLPKELLSTIFNHLDLKNLANCSGVNPTNHKRPKR